MATQIPFRRDFTCRYGVAEILSPLVRRVTAQNAGPFTFKGTGTYIVGHGRVAVIDPGPDREDHVAALIQALDGETVSHIVITHTHIDHSPAAAGLQRATGAKTYGFGPHGSGRAATRETSAGPSEEGGDRSFVPDVVMREGDTVDAPGWRLTAVETPGHTSNHLCFALAEERTLFSGDHVMGWSTSVIAPPDGDMTAYMNSLAKLLPRDDLLYRPTHGAEITAPQPYVEAFIAHRNERSAAILARLAAGDTTIAPVVGALYVGLDPRLIPAAGRSVLAHLVALVEEGRVFCDGPPRLDSSFRLTR